tara:strand:+ start:1479 stop:1922 length:444 start_codon:yes stop_codon:yes gene_type:complete
MDPNAAQQQAEGILGYILYFFLSGVALILVKSTMESLVESIKIFYGKDLNTDDVVILDGRPARVIRVGLWKTTFFAYDVGTAEGKPYVMGGTKIQIQNDKLKDHVIERPLQLLDLSKWENKDEIAAYEKKQKEIKRRLKNEKANRMD